MRSTYSVFALGGALLLAVSATRAADDKKGTNQAPPEAAAKAKPSAEASAVHDLHLAHSLIQYGRKHKAPEALITAARILSTHGTVDLEQKPTREAGTDTPKGHQKEKPAHDNSPKALLEEAKKLSNNDPHIVALADSIEISRGAVGGPKRAADVVEAGSIDTFKCTFRGDEVARVGVSGDGDTRLDLYVFDENGKLITSAVGPGDDAIVSWVPSWTGVFYIKIANRGRLPNRYILLTN